MGKVCDKTFYFVSLVLIAHFQVLKLIEVGSTTEGAEE